MDEPNDRAAPSRRSQSGVGCLAGAALAAIGGLVGASLALLALWTLNDGTLRFTAAPASDADRATTAAPAERVAALETEVARMLGPAATATERMARPTMTLRIAARLDPSATPTRTSPPPTPTPLATATATPTFTPEPTATASPSSTVSPSSTAVPRRTPEQKRTPRPTATLRILR